MFTHYFPETRSNHLWTFLLELLVDENKSDITCWEDKTGTFLIRNPARLAALWGERRNRNNMTYEKLSRSLRHYYEKRILRKVPKRKYTYKFNCREILKTYNQNLFRNPGSTGRNVIKNNTLTVHRSHRTWPDEQLVSKHTSPTPSCQPVNTKQSPALDTSVTWQHSPPTVSYTQEAISRVEQGVDELLETLTSLLGHSTTEHSSQSLYIPPHQPAFRKQSLASQSSDCGSDMNLFDEFMEGITIGSFQYFD